MGKSFAGLCFLCDILITRSGKGFLFLRIPINLHMFRTIRSLLVLLTVFVALSSCEKEYSAENGGVIGGGGSQGGTARFTLDGAPGACTTPSIVGSYKKGQTLTAAEKVTLIVNVTEIGTYTISSGTVNGVTFEDQGTFTVTGPQFIELTAVGDVPLATGSFSFIPGVNGCSFSINFEVSTGSSSGTAVYTLKGAPDDCTAPTITGPFVAGTPLTAASSIVITAVVNNPGTYTISTGAANGVTFSASGTFAAGGEQQITLTSTDTPAAAGEVSYTPGTNGCSFKVTYTGGATGNNYLRCKIAGGAVTNFPDALSGTREAAGGGEVMTVNGETPGGNSFDLTMLAIPTLTTGAYGLPATTPMKSNLSIYFDGTTQWSGALSGQSGTFTVTISTLTANRVTGTFSGTLYNASGTGTTTLAITDGEFSVPY